MGILDYFRSGSDWSVIKVKEFLNENDPDDYNLVDVRQPKEYESEHLPGAKLIPIKELPDRLDELDPTKPTITY
ncbi:MAG: rhodanese-like domain-containing protein [Desulforhabdus sp.]|jgi:rhodanese-related sulfurtransferase|nr:rhodanese-like domain-containing protein [Desulforhabdus sp.]